MNSSTLHRRLSPREQADLMDDARHRAVEARREAVDAFWAAAQRALVRAARRTADALSTKAPACRP